MNYLWIILIVVAILVELITVGNIVFIWFAFGSVAAYIVQLFNFPLEAQIMVFAIVTLVSLILLRPLANNYLRGEIVNTNIDRIIGTQFRLEKDLEKDKWYQQTVNSETWSIIEVNRNALPKNTIVEVISIDGVKLVVKKID